MSVLTPLASLAAINKQLQVLTLSLPFSSLALTSAQFPDFMRMVYPGRLRLLQRVDVFSDPSRVSDRAQFHVKDAADSPWTPMYGGFGKRVRRGMGFCTA